MAIRIASSRDVIGKLLRYDSVQTAIPWVEPEPVPVYEYELCSYDITATETCYEYELCSYDITPEEPEVTTWHTIIPGAYTSMERDPNE